ncbi:MAG TPA: GNAT family N-acetyltransferase [Myxococcota bacterium]|nr:GNAT family N-acetyltransferase [Myxococcota bacterium]
MAEIELADGVRAVPRAAWNALVGEDSPFLEWEWLASLEEAGAVGERTGWAARPLVAREGDRVVAACPLYLKSHSEGEFVFDHGWADAAERAGIRYYPKLLVGVPFTPVSGARFLVAESEPRATWIARLSTALREICLANELSGVHVNFCREDELAALAGAGWLPRLGLQYHWTSRGWSDFEEYLGALRHKRRNQVRRELREIADAGVAIETRAGSEIPGDWFEPMWRFYRATVDDNPWGRRYLNPRFFELVRERFAHRLVFAVALRGGHPIAGAFNVQKGDALYGRYWGASEFVRHLHFAVCYYAGIRHCIDRGLRRFEPGAGGQYKQVRGFDAQPTRSAHLLAEPRLADAVARYLAAERSETQDAIDYLRERSALKPPLPPVQGGRLEYPASGAEGAARSEAKPSEVNRRATAQQRRESR